MTAASAPRLRATTALALALLALTACSGGPETTPTELPEATAIPTSPAPTASGTPTADAEPTCETIIPSTTVDDFQELGWSAKSEPLRIGGKELDGGVQCTWGDYSAVSDRVQIFGWAPIDDTEAQTAIQELLSSGWTREDAPEGVYVTESADTAIAPVDGYGFTYLFDDGWVTFADTKQSLVLVEWPPR